MFEAEIQDVALLRDSVATIAELIDEAEFHVRRDGLRMVAADRAMVAVVDFMLKAEAFKSFACDSEARIGVNLVNFLNMLRRAGAGDTVRLRLDSGFLEILIINESTRRFTLPLIDVSREETPPVDKLDFPALVSLSSELLNSGIEDADLITDSITFNLNKDGMSLNAKNDAHSAELTLDSKSVTFNGIKTDAPIRARYSLDYLKKMIKARKLSDNVTLALATDYPLKMVFEVPDKLLLSFILAPRVDEG